MGLMFPVAGLFFCFLVLGFRISRVFSRYFLNFCRFASDSFVSLCVFSFIFIEGKLAET